MRRDRQALSDIRDALDWIAKAMTGKAEVDFLADETLCYAVAQRLTIVGEAVASLGPEVTSRYRAVPWPDIVGLRNILVNILVFICLSSGKLLWTMFPYCAVRLPRF
jgi:uncharacterized protein with HEPN domain